MADRQHGRRSGGSGLPGAPAVNSEQVVAQALPAELRSQLRSGVRRGARLGVDGDGQRCRWLETREQVLERLTNPHIQLWEAAVILRCSDGFVKKLEREGILRRVPKSTPYRRFWLRDVLELELDMARQEFRRGRTNPLRWAEFNDTTFEKRREQRLRRYLEEKQLLAKRDDQDDQVGDDGDG